MPKLMSNSKSGKPLVIDVGCVANTKCIALADEKPSKPSIISGKIAIKGGSLSRKVDVVTAAWQESEESEISNRDIDRGVCVFDRDKGVFVTNYPFKSRCEILMKDNRCGGGMCKASRLMKSVKFDSGTIDMTSYDITAVAWNMPDHYLCYQAPFG